MNDCIYCGEELGSETVVWVGGKPMHQDCHRAYGEEIAALDERAERNAEAMAWAEAEADAWHSQYDDDPNVYGGTYSED
jgi:hypothetical protein